MIEKTREYPIEKLHPPVIAESNGYETKSWPFGHGVVMAIGKTVVTMPRDSNGNTMWIRKFNPEPPYGSDYLRSPRP